jgi:hypothetical protein
MYIPRFSIARPTKIYPSWDFWFENKPSGNPGHLDESWVDEMITILADFGVC